MATRKAMRTSVRWTTASQVKSGTTRTPTSRTPMTTLTSTIAWRTCIEFARTFVPQLVMIISHTLMAQVLSAFHLHPWSSAWRTLLDSTSPLSTSSSSSCLSQSSSSTSSCSLSSSTRRTWKTCAAPRRTRVRTLLTSSSPPQLEKTTRHLSLALPIFFLVLKWVTIFVWTFVAHRFSSSKGSSSTRLHKRYSWPCATEPLQADMFFEAVISN